MSLSKDPKISLAIKKIPPLQVATSTVLLLGTGRLVALGTTGLLKEGILEKSERNASTDGSVLGEGRAGHRTNCLPSSQ